jgi:Ni/Fe-hydrogenase 1 B-type cytochrome subunit
MASYPLKLVNQDARHGRKFVWEFPVRLCHWVTAVSIVTLFATGLFIAYPVATSDGEPYQNFLLGRVREVHFLAGYALLFSFLLRAYWFFAGNKYSRSGVPLFWRRNWWAALGRQVREYMGTARGAVRLGHSSLAGLSYFVLVGMLGCAQIASGFALYGETNPGGFWDRLFGWVIPLLGGSFRARMWHHTFAWGFVIFVILHLYIVIFDSVRYKNGLISSMVSGDKFYEEGDLDSDDWAS